MAIDGISLSYLFTGLKILNWIKHHQIWDVTFNTYICFVCKRLYVQCFYTLTLYTQICVTIDEKILRNQWKFLPNIILMIINVFDELSEKHNKHLIISASTELYNEWKGLKMMKSHYGCVFLFYFRILLWVQEICAFSNITCVYRSSMQKERQFSKIFSLIIILMS